MKETILFKKGDIREDGKIFGFYSKNRKYKDGKPIEHWCSPDYYERKVKPKRNPENALYISKDINTSSDKRWKYLEYNPETKLTFISYKWYKNKEEWVTDKGLKSYNEKLLKEAERKRIEYHKNRGEDYFEFKNNKEKWNKLIKKSKYNALYVAFKNIKKSVYLRGKKGKSMKMDVIFQDIIDQYDKQNGLCYYTGLTLVIVEETKNPYKISVDRMDSNGDYTKNNIVLCCQAINFMKNNYPKNIFCNFLEDVVKNGALIKKE